MRNPESYVDRLRALNLTFATGGRANAILMLNNAIRLDPKDPMNWVVLSKLVMLPSPNDPVPAILHAAELGPDLPLVQYELGNYYLMDPGSYSKARQAFQQAFELSPQHYEAVLGIGYALWLIGDDATDDQIEPLLHKAVDMSPTFLKGRSFLGDYYAGLEETEKAVEQYQAAIDNNPKYYPVYLSMGTAYMTAERNEYAEKPFHAVVDLDLTRPHPPRNLTDFTADCQAHAFLGDIWLERDNLLTAKSEYDAALTDIVNFAPALYGLGTVFHREGKDDDALTQFDKAIRSDSKNLPNAYLARADIRADRKEFAAALSDLQTSGSRFTRSRL